MPEHAAQTVGSDVLGKALDLVGTNRTARTSDPLSGIALMLGAWMVFGTSPRILSAHCKMRGYLPSYSPKSKAVSTILKRPPRKDSKPARTG